MFTIVASNTTISLRCPRQNQPPAAIISPLDTGGLGIRESFEGHTAILS
jgi:hypothetical protein